MEEQVLVEAKEDLIKKRVIRTEKIKQVYWSFFTRQCLLKLLSNNAKKKGIVLKNYTIRTSFSIHSCAYNSTRVTGAFAAWKKIF